MMAKAKTSGLTAAAKTGNGVPYNAKTDDPFAVKPPVAVESAAPVTVPPGFKVVKARVVRPHVSVYLHPRVIGLMKEIAAARGTRAHDLYLEAVKTFLSAEGHDFETLNAD